MATTAASIALNYGYNWITGQPLQSNTLINTGSDDLDFTRIGFWGLGAGEMDGLAELWDSVLLRLMWQSEFDNPAAFHFHRGCDAVIGSGTYPASSGPDQGIDLFWESLQPGIQPLNYNRIAYYAIRLKQLINNPPNTNQNDPSVWADLNPIGLWRGIRTRSFDATGAMTGYGFSTNPAQHYVDLLCRRKFFPEYSIDIVNGADDLPAAVKRRFDWVALADAEAYYDEALANGEPRFVGNYSFSSSTTLQGCITQILTCCRSYQRERAGTLALVPDKPRSSVFTFSRKNADAATFTVTDSALHQAPNVYVPTFRDLLVPSAAVIASISAPDYTNPTVETVNPHPFAPNDYLIFGGTNSRYDGYWQVATVPVDVDEAFSFTLVSKGSNYPQTLGGGGMVGLRYSRFKQRAPEFNHHAHQYARGAVGVGIPAQRNKVRVQTDFANATLDQVQRISYYQMGRALGVDTALGFRPGVQRPAYNPPANATLSCPQWLLDAAGTMNRAIQIEAGDVVTVDDTLSPSYPGEYQVMQVAAQLAGSTAGSGIDRTPAGGKLTLQLEPYSANNYPDVSDPTQAGWFDVPDSGPGRAAAYTSIPLDDGGELAVFSGSGASGDTVALPSGFNPVTAMGWCSPQGYVGGDAHLHFIQQCTYDVNRKLTLIYNDSAGSTWNGDLNYFGIAWRATTSATVTTVERATDLAPWTFVELTLLGGEKICFGTGLQEAAQQVAMPAGYNAAHAVQLAFPGSASDSGQPAFGFGSYVGTDQVAHHFYQDQGAAMTWEGSVAPFFFGVQNNLNSWVQESNGWWHTTLSNGIVVAFGGFTILDADLGGVPPANYPSLSLVRVNNGVLPLPTGLTQVSLQVMTGSNSFQIDADHPAHGQRQCYIDANLNSLCSFQDGEANVWYGAAGVFGFICDVPVAALAGPGTVAPPAPGPLKFVTPGALAPAYIGIDFSQQLTVAGGSGTGYVFTVVAGGTPPSGITISATGLVSFAPSVAGAFAFSVQVTDSAAATATLACAVTVSAALPLISTSSLPQAVVGLPYNQPLAFTGGNGGAVTWRISAGSLPSFSGLALSQTGIVYGNPTQTGVYQFSVIVNVGGTDSAAVQLGVLVDQPSQSSASDSSRPIDTSI